MMGWFRLTVVRLSLLTIPITCPDWNVTLSIFSVAKSNIQSATLASILLSLALFDSICSSLSSQWLLHSLHWQTSLYIYALFCLLSVSFVVLISCIAFQFLLFLLVLLQISLSHGVTVQLFIIIIHY